MRHTKVVCTLGPASWSPEKIRALIAAGMNVARLNLSHGTHEEHRGMMKEIRAAAAEAGVVVGILLDLQGPKIRLGDVVDGGVRVKAGEEVAFGEGGISVGYAKLHEAVDVGMQVTVGDGSFLGEVSSIAPEKVLVKALADGVLEKHKGFSVRGGRFIAPALTEKDLRDVEFGLSAGVDIVALSFVKDAQDILQLRGKVATYASMHGIASHDLPMIVAKVERHEAIAKIDSIIAAADGIMVARGDLGLDMPIAQVPLLQKEIAAKCRMAAKPVIVATQMMESMTENLVPTRAEVSDVANAVIDHADAVMLSGETANGQHPVEVVEAMVAVLEETEKSRFDDMLAGDAVRGVLGRDEMVSRAILLAQEKTIIMVCPGDVDVVRRLAATRPGAGIMSCVSTSVEAAVQQMSWGVVAVVVGEGDESGMIAEARAAVGKCVMVNPLTGSVGLSS
jgi:pyruvate kinase